MGPEFLTQLLLTWKYWVLAPANFVLGPIVGLMAGVLIRADILEFIPTLTILVVGAILGDILWYWIGYHWGERFATRFGKYVGVTESHIFIAKNLFNKYHMRILFISKVTSGLGLAVAVLFTAGLSRVPFKRFLLINIIGELVWSTLLLTTGFFISNLVVKVNNALEWASAVGIILLIFGILFGAGHYARKRLFRSAVPQPTPEE